MFGNCIKGSYLNVLCRKGFIKVYKLDMSLLSALCCLIGRKLEIKQRQIFFLR